MFCLIKNKDFDKNVTHLSYSYKSTYLARVIQFQSIDFTSALLESGTFAIFRAISDVTNGGL